MISVPIVFLVLLLSLAGSEAADGGPVPQHTEDECRPVSGNPAFGSGERLVYTIGLGPIEAGTSQTEITGISLVNGQPCYRIVSQTVSNRAFSVLYNVDDYIESYVDVERLVSRGIRKRIREGSYRLDNKTVYDRERHLAISGTDTTPVPPCVQDIVSGFYYLRTLDLRPGETVTIATFDNGKLHSLRVRVLRRERVSLRIGSFDCLVVEPVLLQPTGLFRRKGKFTMWLTDDSRRLPVLMKSEIAVGSVEVRLVEYTPADTGRHSQR